MRWNRRKALKLIISDDIVGSSKSCGRVFPNTFTSFAFSFGTSGWRSEVIISREGVEEDGVPKIDKGAGVSSFPSSSLRFFDSRVRWDTGSFFRPFTRAYLSLLYLVAISASKRSERRTSFSIRKKKKKKKKKGKTSLTYSFLPE